MDFRIADTFTDSLACLTVDWQKAVKRRKRPEDYRTVAVRAANHLAGV